MTAEQPIARPSEPVVHKITVDEFLALDEAGFFEDRRVELIDGEIYEMAPLHRPHARAVIILGSAVDAAVAALNNGMEVLAEPSARLSDHNLPQADIVVADYADTRFVERPTVRLLIEISESSLRLDLGPKLKVYARTGVPEYWVADVSGRKIIRFHAPHGDVYAERTEFGFGETVPAATIAGLSVHTHRLN